MNGLSVAFALIVYGIIGAFFLALVAGIGFVAYLILYFLYAVVIAF